MPQKYSKKSQIRSKCLNNKNLYESTQVTIKNNKTPTGST